MKEQEITVVEQGENWSNLPPELDAAVDRAHVQIVAGQYTSLDEVFDSMHLIINESDAVAQPIKFWWGELK